MLSLILPFLIIAQITAKTTWYATYDLSSAEVDKLTEAGCYRGVYGGGEKRSLHLLSCPHSSAQKFAEEMNDDAHLCIIELSQDIHVSKAVNVLSDYTKTHKLLYVGKSEIIIVSTTNELEKPELCNIFSFESALNAINLPKFSISPQRSPPVNNPAYIKSVLEKENLIPDQYIQKLLATYTQASVVNELRTLSTGNDGTNTKITRNSYATGVGKAGCADATWKCAHHSVQYVVDRINYYFRDYPHRWSVTTSSFRADMCHNVVLDVIGLAEPEKFVLTGAHLDSRNTGSGPTATGIAPGADDNGTGSAVHLALAKLIGENKVRFAYTVRLMWFCGEEQGLLGSAALASLYKAEGLDIQAMFNMDMIGYTDPNVGITLSFVDGAATPWLTQSCKDISKTYLPDLKIGNSQACCSDQQSFHNRGIPATGIFETPSRSVIYPRYHQTGDQWDTGLINFDQITFFGQAISACILEYAVPLP